MFGWFRPTCPCDPVAKRWVEDQLRWLTKHFGLHILLERPIILPTPEFFPDDWKATPKSARRLFQRVCSYMQVDPDDIQLKFFNDKTPQAFQSGMAAGLWSSGDDSDDDDDNDPANRWRGRRSVIRLEHSTLDRPSDLIGTMAHELAHQRLLGEGRIDPNRFDNELLTDLTAVFHGFGIFLANNPRKSTGKLSHWPGTNLRRPEYLSEPMLGYALAHIAWFRDEDRPTWLGHLNWALRGTFKQGHRWLRETEDSAFKPIRVCRHEEDGD